MASSGPHTHLSFGEFTFDPDRLALYFRGELIRVERKALEVLVVLIRSPRKLTTTQEILESVWPENVHGITSTHIAQNIRKLRRAFSSFEPGADYIKTVKGSGFVFAAEVIGSIEPSGPGVPNGPSPSRSPRKAWNVAMILLLLMLVTMILAVVIRPNDDEREIRRVLEESQKFESLVLYKNPKAVTESDLDRFWLQDPEGRNNLDRRRIREAIEKLIKEGRHYGDETGCEQFEIQDLQVDENGETATAKTLEKWFVSSYFDDGTLHRNRTIGPYFVNYILRKVDGRWMIERSTTARVNRPIPRLMNIEFITEPVAGKQFYVRITGQDFEGETVFVEVTGPGCPESRSCRVPNSALREEAKLSDTILDNVPLTLASGEFTIAIRNGDSRPSESLPLRVP